MCKIVLDLGLLGLIISSIVAITCHSNVGHQYTRFIPTMLYSEALVHDLQSISGRRVSDSDRPSATEYRMHGIIKLFALFKLNDKTKILIFLNVLTVQILGILPSSLSLQVHC